MKKLLLLLVLSLALVVPALADGTVTFTADLTKDVTITETITVTNDFTFTADVTFLPDSTAQAKVFKEDVNDFNSVASAGNFDTDTIFESFNGFTGIAQVNQASGSSNNQGNAVAAAVVNGTFAILEAQAAIQMDNTGNVLASAGDVFTDQIGDSFNDGFSGLAQVNQAAGYMNNQNNVLALAADRNGGIVALADSALAQTNSLNVAAIAGAVYTNNISNSFNGGFTGLAQVNQSAGSMNNQANVVSIAASAVR